MPIVFYKSLKKRFPNEKLLFFLSSLIYLFPAFQYSAIWGNNHVTALFFFVQEFISTMISNIKMRKIYLIYIFQ